MGHHKTPLIGQSWVQFNTQPIKPNSVPNFNDGELKRVRVQMICNTLDEHLGHVFPDNSTRSNIRYCVSAFWIKLITLMKCFP